MLQCRNLIIENENDFYLLGEYISARITEILTLKDLLPTALSGVCGFFLSLGT